MVDKDYISTSFFVIVLTLCYHTVLSTFVISETTNQKIPSRTSGTTSQLHFTPLIEIEPNFLPTSAGSISILNNDFTSCLNKEGYFPPKAEEIGNEDDESNYYILGIAEEDDLPPIAQLTIESFGADMVLFSQELNEFEKALINPVAGLWNSYTNVFAYTEVLFGLRSRLSSRLTQQLDGIINPSSLMGNTMSKKEMYDIAAKSSLVLCLARTTSSSNQIDCIATVEVRLQPTDAKIPFSQPWIDVLERKLMDYFKIQLEHVDTSKPSLPLQLQPYLCNLCVSRQYRKQNIAQTLVGIIEYIAFISWGFDKLYLHVDVTNKPALQLYKKLGYRDAGWRWNPFWAGGAGAIGYFVKNKGS